MIKYYIGLVIIFSTSTIYAQESHFKMYSLYDEIPFRIMCDEMDKCAGECVEFKLNKSEHKKFSSLLKSMQSLEKYVVIDARYKGVVDSLNICGNETYMEVNGKQYSVTPKMEAFLNKLFESRLKNKKTAPHS